MRRPTVAVLATVGPAGEQGGAERFYEGLVAALGATGRVEAERVDLLCDERNFRGIQEGYLRAYDLELDRFDGVISTKAPGHAIRHRNHVCYLQHTIRAFYDMFDRRVPHPTSEDLRQRELIRALDSRALLPPHTKAVFAIGEEVRRRLLRYNELDAEVLYQASTMKGMRQGEYRYAFLPGRLHPWKRVDLVIRAMAHVRRPLELRISGSGEQEEELRELAHGDPRIVFEGRVSEARLIELYADALVVPFVPIREDFGLITLEAFQSHKPVITCRDSGEPAEIVRNGELGFVCEPRPEAIAEKLEYFYDHPERARQMGGAGAEWVARCRWKQVSTRLLDALKM